MPFFDALLSWTTELDMLLWGPGMLALLLGTHVYLTIRTRGVQFVHFWPAVKLLFSREARSVKGRGDVSPFAALMTALAGTVGNGNIAGVGTAIAIGGPGAPLYMWLAGLFGIATKYAEGFLGVYYREVAPNQTMAGGPMYYLKNGLKHKKAGRYLGAVFALCGAIACLIGTGNMTQSNSMTLSLANSLNRMVYSGAVEEQAPAILYVLLGALIAFLVGLVIIGGIKKIARVSERLVPAMIIFYLAAALYILLVYFEQIPAAFALIVKSAFGIQPLVGATVGLAIQSGVSRGLLSNEAGLGTAGIAQGASTSEDPTRNGLIAMTGVVIDTLLVNTMTTLTIILTGAYLQTQSWQGLGAANNLTSILVTQKAFHTVIPLGMGDTIVAIASFLFGYTTLIGWAYYGEKCIEFLGGNRAIMPYRYVFIVFIFFGAILTPLAGNSYVYLNIIWSLGNIGNAIMAVPNLIGLLILAGTVAAVSRERL